MGGLVSIDDSATFTLDQVKEMLGEVQFDEAEFVALAGEAGTITGAQLKEKIEHMHCNVVSVNPYLEVQEGRDDDLRALFAPLIEVVKGEAGCLHYETAFNGNVFSVRESYVDAAALLIHNGNAGETIGKALEFCKLLHFEVVGLASQLEKLREPMAPFNPTFYIVEQGFRKPVVSSEPGAITVSPYFDIPEDKMVEFKATWDPVLPAIKADEGTEYYEMSFNGNSSFFREGYRNADAVLAHLGRRACVSNLFLVLNDLLILCF